MIKQVKRFTSKKSKKTVNAGTYFTSLFEVNESNDSLEDEEFTEEQEKKLESLEHGQQS